MYKSVSFLSAAGEHCSAVYGNNDNAACYSQFKIKIRANTVKVENVNLIIPVYSENINDKIEMRNEDSLVVAEYIIIKF